MRCFSFSFHFSFQKINKGYISYMFVPGVYKRWYRKDGSHKSLRATALYENKHLFSKNTAYQQVISYYHVGNTTQTQLLIAYG